MQVAVRPWSPSLANSASKPSRTAAWRAQYVASGFEAQARLHGMYIVTVHVTGTSLPGKFKFK